MPLKILKHYNGNLSFFYLNLEQEIKNFKITENSIKKLKNKNLFSCEKIVNLCFKLNIKIVCYYDKNYPPRLKEISCAPIVLYYIGNLKAGFSPCVSVVGTRNCSEFSYLVTKNLCKKLVEYNITTISGCAKGVDFSVHKETLKLKGNTIAVLGTPLDSPYPFEHKQLKISIVKNNGLIISEYPPKTETKAWHFPIRNRIISAMGDCTIVVQAKEKSGTIITAKKTLEFKKKVFFIPPYNIFDENFNSVKKCLQKGAKLLLDINDILKIYKNSKFKLTQKNSQTEKTKKECTKNKKLPKKFASLFNLIDKEKRLDEILSETDFKPNEVLFMLTQMELLNLIQKTKIGYKRCWILIGFMLKI